MKRIVSLILCLVMVFLFAGCGEKEVVEQNDTTLLKQGTISVLTAIELKDEAGKVWLSNEHFIRVYAMHNEQNGYFIQLELTDEGEELFAEATRANIGKMISVLADGETLIAATVQQEIRDDSIALVNNESEEALMTLFNKLAKPKEE